MCLPQGRHRFLGSLRRPTLSLNIEILLANCHGEGVIRWVAHNVASKPSTRRRLRIEVVVRAACYIRVRASSD